MTDKIICPAHGKPPYAISFHRDGGERIGYFDFNGPKLVFTGKAEEGAQIFVAWVVQLFNARLLEERASAIAEHAATRGALV